MRCLIFAGLFLQKSLIISGEFVARDLQDKASYGFSPLSALLLYVKMLFSYISAYNQLC